jgi:hypothetical protein
MRRRRAIGAVWRTRPYREEGDLATANCQSRLEIVLVRVDIHCPCRTLYAPPNSHVFVWDGVVELPVTAALEPSSATSRAPRAKPLCVGAFFVSGTRARPVPFAQSRLGLRRFGLPPGALVSSQAAW